MTIEEMRERRAAAFERMRELNDAAESEDRDLSGEEAQEYERLDGEFDDLTGRIARAEQLEGRAPTIGRPDSDVLPDTDPEERTIVPADEFREVVDAARRGGAEQRAEMFGHDGYLAAFEALIRSAGELETLAAEQRVALAVGTDAAGGYTVPDAFLRRLVEAQQAFGVIRQFATVITTGDHGDMSIPSVATHGSAAWLAEAAAFAGTEPTFGEVTLGSHKGGALWKVSEEMIADSAFDVLGFLARKLGEAVAKLENAAFANGASNSTTSPKGVVNRGTVGVTAASETAVTTDELIDVQYALARPYRKRATWFFSDATAKAIRKLKDSDGQYIWQPGIRAGEPDTLLGRPIAVDDDIPDIASAAKPIVYGDLSGYYVRDVEARQVRVLNELFAANGQVGVRVHFRVDGDVVDGDAITVLQQDDGAA